jgi:hypothetical protein
MMQRIAELESTHQGLNLLKISLNYTDTAEPTVHFEMTRAGESLGLLEMLGSEIGLPFSRDDAYEKDSQADLPTPGRLVDFLLATVVSDRRVVYIAFVPPSGYLPLVPWERLIGPALGLPVLRLPTLPLRPIVPQSHLTVAFCMTLPLSKQYLPPLEVLDQFIHQMAPQPQMPGTVHVFADEPLYAALGAFANQLPNRDYLQLHDPKNAQKYDLARRTTDISDDQSNLESPWLLWMRDELQGTGIDAVHFLCHGYLGRTRGGLAVAESPMINVDREWARFIGTRQLSTFLEQLGAWCALFSGPPDNFSRSGLRMLQAEMAEILPLPTVLHDMRDDPGGVGLQAAYHFLFDQKETPPPASGALSMVFPPSWVLPDQHQGEEKLNTMFQELTLAGRLGRQLKQSQNLPGWVAAAQRSLERAVANVSVNPANDIEAAEQKGSQDALRFMADLYTKYAIKGTKSTPQVEAQVSESEEVG